jgi:hypothetical protein
VSSATYSHGITSAASAGSNTPFREGHQHLSHAQPEGDAKHRPRRAEPRRPRRAGASPIGRVWRPLRRVRQPCGVVRPGRATTPARRRRGSSCVRASTVSKPLTPVCAAMYADCATRNQSPGRGGELTHYANERDRHQVVLVCSTRPTPVSMGALRCWRRPWRIDGGTHRIAVSASATNPVLTSEVLWQGGCSTLATRAQWARASSAARVRTSGPSLPTAVTITTPPRSLRESA